MTSQPRSVPARVLVASLALVMAGCSGSSLGSDVTEALRTGVEELAVDDLLSPEPAITTSFSDAVTGVPFLDGYQPTTWRPLSVLPQSEDNMYRLASGRFEFISQSYCLHAGTHGPSEGGGYLWAPLRGPRADIVSSILMRSVDHPEIAQRDVQTLIWAVLARVEFSDMPRERQAVAATLLTPEELVELNGGALGLVPDDVLDRAARQLPEPARAALRARAELRSLYHDAEAGYEQMEEAAVLAGVAPEEQEVRHVPATRWSYHPDGYFLRYRPDGYRRLRIQLYVPHRFELERNAAGAITAIANADGDRIAIEYAEDPAPASSSSAEGAGPGASELRAATIERVRFVRTATMGPEVAFRLEDGWSDAGWTLIGAPGGAGAEAPDRPGAETRLSEAEAMAERLTELEEMTGGSGAETRADVVDLGHLVLALRGSLGGGELSGWRADHLLMLQEAWAWALCRHSGECGGSTRPAGRVATAGEGTLRQSVAGPATTSGVMDGPPSGPRAGRTAAASNGSRSDGSRPLFAPGPSPMAGQASQEGGGGPQGCAAPANTGEQRLCPSGRNGGRPGEGGDPSDGAAPPGAGDPPGRGAGAEAGDGNGQGGAGDGAAGDPGAAGGGDPGDPGEGDPGDPDDESDDTPPDDIDRPEPEDYEDEEPDEQTCEAVREAIGDAQIVRDAFADEDILARAEWEGQPGLGTGSYREEVYESVGEQYAETGETIEAPMNTNSDCEVSALPRSEYTENGTPGVIWDAERWHEQVHRENCQANPDWYEELAEEPSAIQEEELEAYDEVLDVLEGYDEQHCRP